MELNLDEAEIRVLGSLMEKALATPDYYPLSLNALTGACNQKSNRDPVVSYDEEAVDAAADRLIERGLVNREIVGRVHKYEELLTRRHDLVPRESAVLCVLLLRGPQTPGAIRSRTGRLCTFDDLDGVGETLENLTEWGLVAQLPRMPGHKESRFTHLLAGEAPPTEAPDRPAPPPSDAAAEPEAAAPRMDDLAEEVKSLRSELAGLRSAFEAFRKQFED